MNGPLPLLEYQHEGAAWLASRERGGLFDEMGVGKTAQAISACDRIGAKRIMVVCPAAVREVWAGEFKKFATIPRKVIKGRTIHDLGLWLKGRADVLLTSYDMAARWADRIEEAADLIDVLIVDESHYLKSSTAQRTRRVLGDDCDGMKGLARWAVHAWFLSGTPLPNDPVDIWPFLRFVGGTPLTISAFTKRYFRSYNGTFSARQTPRDEMIPELKQCLAATSIRRTKKEVGIMLPPIWLTTQTLDGDTDEIRMLLRDYPGLEDEIVSAVEMGGLSFLSSQHVATLRRLVGEAKAPACAELIAEELQNGLEKVIVFGLHRRALSIVADHLNSKGLRAGLFDGGTSERDRGELVTSFQNDPSTRAFVGNIRAAGTGLTLTAGADVVMLEQSWTPADNAQALMRVHRLGQTKECRARFMSLANSIDEIVAERVAAKTSAIISIQGT